MKMKYYCNKLIKKVLDMAVTAAITELTSYVTAWCWNQAGVQEMRRKFEGLLSRAERVNPTAQQSNTANLRVQQLLRQLEDEARQGKELLDGEPTPSNLSNAKESFKRIQVVTLEINQLLFINARETSNLFGGGHPKIKMPQFKPRYLRRRTRLQVISRCKF